MESLNTGFNALGNILSFLNNIENIPISEESVKEVTWDPVDQDMPITH